MAEDDRYVDLGSKFSKNIDDKKNIWYNMKEVRGNMKEGILG